jgi:multiple antibiotic resistance protein
VHRKEIRGQTLHYRRKWNDVFMTLKLIFENSLYFLALINPTSKVFLLSSMDPPYTWKELRTVSVKATVVALFILLVLTGAGSFMMKVVFHVDIYSLRVAGGIVLFIIGLTAVRQGRFFEKNIHDQHTDISIVPLAAPLIAGPGTITAAIAFASEHGEMITISALIIAVLINFLFMLGSKGIGAMLEKFSATGPLIRITGLVVAAVAVQMILGGLGEWIQSIFVSLESMGK